VLFIAKGPGLAVRVICAEEPYLEKDFAETSLILKLIVDYANAVKKVSAFLCLLYSWYSLVCLGCGL